MFKSPEKIGKKQKKKHRQVATRAGREDQKSALRSGGLA